MIVSKVMDKVGKAILKTIAFFDVFDRPLILDEIWQFLYCERASQIQVLIGLQKLEKNHQVLQKNQYFCLKDRQKIIDDFLSRSQLIRNRWQKVGWIVKIIRHAPFVKNISIINSLSYNNSREDSDIDLLLIAQKNRLWTARAFVILLLEILGQNKNKWYKAGKFCLGFAFDQSRLDMSQIKFRNDIDFTYWLANLTPVYDRGVYRKLIEANPWLHEELPNWEKKEFKIQNLELGALEKMLSSKLGDRLEKMLAKVQIGRIWQDPKNKRNAASVIADSSMMKLHPYDKRRLRYKAWSEKVKNIIKT